MAETPRAERRTPLSALKASSQRELRGQRPRAALNAFATPKLQTRKYAILAQGGRTHQRPHLAKDRRVCSFLSGSLRHATAAAIPAACLIECDEECTLRWELSREACECKRVLCDEYLQ